MTCNCDGGRVPYSKPGYDGKLLLHWRPCRLCAAGQLLEFKRLGELVAGDCELIARLYRRVEDRDKRIVELEAALHRIAGNGTCCDEHSEQRNCGAVARAALRGAVVESVTAQRDPEPLPWLRRGGRK